MHVSIPPKSDNLVDGGLWSLGAKSFVRFDGPSSRVDFGFRLEGIGICSVAFSGGIPTGTWGVSTGTCGCSSCAALRLSLLRLHSPCVDLFSAFELYLSICINLQVRRTKIQRTHRYFHQCNAENFMRVDRKKWHHVQMLHPRIRSNLKSSLTAGPFLHIGAIHIVTVSKYNWVP